MNPLKSTIFWLLLGICISSYGQKGIYTSSNPLSKIESNNIFFEENQGQWSDAIKYRSFGASDLVSFFQNSVQVEFIDIKHYDSDSEQLEFSSFKLEQCFVNSSPTVSISPLYPNITKTNYLFGKDLSKHVVGVSQYAKLVYEDIYPNINLIFQSQKGYVKHDFVVNPGGNINDIVVSYRAVDRITINENNQLVIHSPVGELIEDAPYTYQLINQKKVEVPCSFKLLNDSTYTFALEDGYDPSFTLVIDPVWVNWSTYCGGVGANVEGMAHDVESDEMGHVYGGGDYLNLFPTTAGVIQGTYSVNVNSVKDAFLYKLAPNGTSLIWATYIGGSSHDLVEGIEVNDNQEVFISGYTSSPNFPVTPTAFDTVGDIYGDAFVMRLNTNCTSIMYSTMIGGTMLDRGMDLAIDGNNYVYLTGMAKSPDFPTVNAWDATHNGDIGDAYITKIKPDGTGLVFSTFFGGSAQDQSSCIKLSCDGDIYIYGLTKSSDLPSLSHSYDDSYNGVRDYYLAKFSNNGSSLLGFTFYGGPVGDGYSAMDDFGSELFVTPQEEAIVVGYTEGPGFPITPNAYKQTFNSSTVANASECIVGKFSSDLDTLIFSTYLGGTIASSFGSGVAADNAGNIWVVGQTNTHPNLPYNDFPVTPDAIKDSAVGNYTDLFVSKLSSDGSTLLYSTYYGGGHLEEYAKLVIRKDNEIVIGANTLSTNFPATPGAFQSTKLNTGPWWLWQPMAFVLIDTSSYAMDCNQTVFPYDFYFESESEICEGECLDLIPIHYGVTEPGTYTWSNSVTSSSLSTMTICPTVDTTYYLIWEDITGFKDTIFAPITVHNLEVDLGNDTTLCQGNGVLLDAQNSGASYLWSDGSTQQGLTVNTAGLYWVNVNNGFCTVSDSVNVLIESVSLNLNDAIMCQEDSLIIDAQNPGASYLWSTGETTQSINVYNNGTYWVAVNNNGCVNSDTMMVQFVNYAVNLGSDTTLCLGESIQLEAGVSGSYSWNNSSSLSSLTASNSGVYWVTVDSLGCTVTDSIEIFYHQIALNLGADTAICEGDSVTLHVNQNGGTILWSNGSVDSFIYVDQTGEYWVQINDLGCEFIDSIFVLVNPMPTANLGADTSICFWETITLGTLNSVGNYIWSDGSISSSVNVSPPGEYWVEVHNGNCIDSDTIYLGGLDCHHEIVMPNVFTPNGDADNNLLFPINVVGVDGGEVYIYNRWGQLLYFNDDFYQGWDGTYKGEEVPEGTYYWIIHYNHQPNKKSTITGNVLLIR